MLLEKLPPQNLMFSSEWQIIELIKEESVEFCEVFRKLQNIFFSNCLMTVNRILNIFPNWINAKLF